MAIVMSMVMVLKVNRLVLVSNSLIMNQLGYKYLMEDKDHAHTTKEELNHKQKDKDLTKLPPKNNQSAQQKPNVCRRLDFGTDAEEGTEDFAFLLDEDLEQRKQTAREKWNFDFENEVPLEGDWEWERVPTQPPETKEVVYSMEKKNHDNRTV
ncbi:hypothetical protein NQ315_003923 [Exocentrus adspersus]|uniref:Cyclin-dependent kinase inhibitor domain-containing protein n=1 Tax=Exocentrus adspersus TaxID=1586481 RepID=A0AAV8VYN2_9CUCU|nr:hypothetical protein NQ315_003923 [Exocentrus adspersus]